MSIKTIIADTKKRFLDAFAQACDRQDAGITAEAIRTDVIKQLNEQRQNILLNLIGFEQWGGRKNWSVRTSSSQPTMIQSYIALHTQAAVQEWMEREIKPALEEARAKHNLSSKAIRETAVRHFNETLRREIDRAVCRHAEALAKEAAEAVAFEIKTEMLAPDDENGQSAP